MNKNKNILLLLLLIALSLGCTSSETPRAFSNDDDDDRTNDRTQDDEQATDDFDDVESWELMPFYGELRFDMVDEGSQSPLPEATIIVENLRLSELDELGADENGRITLHQLTRGITYWGSGPPPPLFRFAAPDCTPRDLTVAELAALAGYDDPYSSEGIPEVEWTNETDSVQTLPLREFVVTLSCE